MPLPYQEIIALLLQYKYLIFFPLVMIEGPITTIIAGFLASLGYFNFAAAFLLAAVADLASDGCYYMIGRWGRKNLIERFGRYVGITEARLGILEKHFERYGGKMLVFGKIADPLSAAMQTMAGGVRMPVREYAFYNIISTFPKSFILVTIGYYFGEAIYAADFYRKAFGIAASVAGVLVLAAYLIYRKKKERDLLDYDSKS